MAAALQRHLGEVTAEQWVAAFHGPDRAAQDEAARAACAAAGVSLLHVDLAALAEREAFDHDVRLVFREAALRGAAVLLDGADAVARDGDKGGARARSLDAAMLEMGWVTFVAGSRAWEPADALKRQHFFTWEFPAPTYLERRSLWHAELDGDAPAGGEADVDELAGQFKFTRGEIKNAASVARTLALLRGDPGSILERGDLQQACRAESNPRLLSFGRRVRARYDWDELVLSPEQRTQLREIAMHPPPRGGLDGLGLRGQARMGKGLNVLFSGPSGTGKTMAADVLAGDLGLDLYKIDLSSVVSKYIGETEKNLAAIFARGRDAQRDPLLRRGRRPLRQAIRGQGRARSLRQHRGRLPAPADGGVRRHRDPGHQPAAEPGRGVHAAAALRRRIPVAREEERPASGTGSSRRRRPWPPTSTSPSSHGGSSWPAATSGTSRSTRRSSPPRRAGDRDAPRHPRHQARVSEDGQDLRESRLRRLLCPRHLSSRKKDPELRPLEPALRARAEVALGHDLGRVRVARGPIADAKADELGARAFTVGADVYFARGDGLPGTEEGERLLFHELTHVAQQQRDGAPS